MEIFILDSRERAAVESKAASTGMGEVFPQGPAIFFEGNYLPYDKEQNIFYLSQSLKETDWQGKLGLSVELQEEGYALCGIEDDYWYDKGRAIAEAHVYELWVVGREKAVPLKLAVSGVPVMNITTVSEISKEAANDKEALNLPESRMPYSENLAESEVPAETEYPSESEALAEGERQTRKEDDPPAVQGAANAAIEAEKERVFLSSLMLFDPDRSGEEYAIIKCNATYHQKGISSMYFPKKSYNLDLLDENMEQLKIPFLGMREDDDWKLNSLYADRYMVREKTAAQIWELIDRADDKVDEAGPVMEYIEVVMDGSYQGVYTLVEPVDPKKCGLDENDVLYKVGDWHIPTVRELKTAVLDKQTELSSVRVRHPKEITDYAAVWRPMQDYLRAFYRGGVDYDTAVKKVDIDNLTDYHIFLKVVTATDNHWKNLYYSAYVEEDGSYRMILRPWDLDYTFGNNFELGRPIEETFNHNLTLTDTELAINRLRAEEKDIGRFIYEKWENFREDILSMESIAGLLNGNMEYLKTTGAASREAARWPEREVSTDLEEIMIFQRRRLKWLDNWFRESAA